MKIYTKTGDEGETSLFTGKRVLKSNVWVKLYGGLDQLNSSIGLLCAKLEQNTSKDFSSICIELKKNQCQIFSVGSYYASEGQKKEHIAQLLDWVLRLEHLMDEWESSLKPLKNFILPGGSFESALAHQVRVQARLVERDVVESGFVEALQSLSYLNRLSDYFFVLARYINLKLDNEDVIWSSEV